MNRPATLPLLPWTSPEGKPCYLSTDKPDSPLSRLADDVEVEEEQLTCACDVSAAARAVPADARAGEHALRFALTRAAESLRDALRVAESRGGAHGEGARGYDVAE